MAQLDDNDQRQQARARRPNASRRTADERRHGHDHLLLASPRSCSSPASSCCCSTSSSSCCSAASTSSAASAGAPNELGAGDELRLRRRHRRHRRGSREKPQTRLKRGQYLGRQAREGYNSQGRASSSSATAAAVVGADNDIDTIMQSEPSRPSARTRNELVPNVLALNQAAVGATTCRSNRRSQLDRQLSDSSGIGAQLMNVLRIDDDLSSSSSSVRFLTTRTTNSNMLMGHPQQQQQQQQQQQELDTRSLTLATTTTTATSGATMSSTAATATTTAAPYDQHNHQDQLILTRAGPQMPLVVVSPIPPLHASPPVPQYPHQSLYLSSQEAAGIYGQHAGSQPPPSSSYAMYPVMEPTIMMHSSPFHDHEHHHHQHHLNHHLNHHHHHHHNHSQNRHIESLACPADQLTLDQNPQQQQQLSYADLDEEMARHQAKRREQRQEQQSGPGLPESVIEANGEQLDSNQQRPRHHNSYNYYHSGQVLPQQQQQQPPHQAYSESRGLPSGAKAENTTLTAHNASLDHSHQHQRLGGSTDSRCRLSHGAGDLSSSVGLDVGQQSSQSPTEMDDELKVCEWRDCGNTFLDMNEFVRHLEEKHVNLEPPERNRFFCMWHNCKRNNQEFNARYKLLIHMRVHSGEKPYLCNSESCKKSFSRLENLKIHMRSHTGEKPYECQYENCAKKFTNSSDRIKHHKTHKDPKPYNCSHEGCTKRYTDPSSLRKHLRAHKRHSFGCPVDSPCEAPTVADMMSKPRHHQQHQIHENSSTGCSFPASHLDRSLSQSASHYGLAPDRNQHHQQEEQQQQQQQQPYEQFASSGSGQHQQLIEIVQDQHELGGYLHADYDPSREFASVLFSPSEHSEMSATRDHNQTELTSCVTDHEATYYNEHSDYERPSYQQQQQMPIETPMTSGSTEYYRPKEVQADHNDGRYLVPPPTRTSFASRQRPSYAGRLSTRADDLHERHQQLSKSWCGASGGGSMRESFGQPQSSWTQPAGPSRVNRMEAVAQDGDHMQAHKSRRRVGFDCGLQEGGGDYEQNRWPQAEQQQANYQQQQMEDVRYEKYPNQQQPQQHWQPATSSNVDIRYGGHHQSQPQHQQRQRQQQQQNQHQLTRSQQHAQLMRSMPADVNFFQSRGPQQGFD